MKDNQQQPHECFDQNSFPEYLLAKSLQEYRALSHREKIQCVADTEKNVSSRVEAIECEAEQLQVRIAIYKEAEKLSLDDADFLDLLKTDLSQAEWLRDQKEGIGELPEIMELKYVTEALRKSCSPRNFVLRILMSAKLSMSNDPSQSRELLKK